jgi:DNA (cytosine-5)-methyltransferase 1
MKVAALFAGVAGLELGLSRSGHKVVLFNEIDPGAIEVLKTHFPKIPIHPDIRDLDGLPSGIDLITAGFPCQDISQVGPRIGINGEKSGLIDHLFRILEKNDVPNVLIENVPFMLQLHRGEAIKQIVDSLEKLEYNWAYRTVDTRAFGLPQRRKRVFLLASKVSEPWHSLFTDDETCTVPEYKKGIACGFYWTEGNRGLGWAVNAIPTLKGGSAVGISSPPAIWMPDGRIVTPDLRDAERLQGFPAEWTKPAEKTWTSRHRWRLIGNAVTVDVAEWLGRCIRNIGRNSKQSLKRRHIMRRKGWSSAAYGASDCSVQAVDVSEWPVRFEGRDLTEFLEFEPVQLSHRATKGFAERLNASSLHYEKDFMRALIVHRDKMKAKMDR